jgi:hypothetical protein
MKKYPVLRELYSTVWRTPEKIGKKFPYLRETRITETSRTKRDVMFGGQSFDNYTGKFFIPKKHPVLFFSKLF